MSAVEDILAQLPMDRLASQLGTDPQTAEAAARQAVPALLGGLRANAADPAGEQSLAGALGDHDNDLLTGGVDLDQVDTHEGDKIVSNIFGGNRDQVAQTLGGHAGLGQSDLMSKLLPILAPIVLSYLAKRVGGGSGGILGSLLGGAAGGAGAGGLGSILEQVMGGGAQPAEPRSDTGSITDILGGLLGGGRR